MKLTGIKYLLVFLILFSSGVICSETETSPESTDKNILIGILPFANNSGTNESKNLIVPLLESSLIEAGLDIIPISEIRNTLRKYRIRSAGSINKENARIIQDNLSTTHLLLGSFDIYDSTNIEASFSVRLIDVENMRITWADSYYAAGSDFESILGLGRIDKIEMLCERLIAKFKKSLMDIISSPANQTSNDSTRNMAIIPFDNLSSRKAAGKLFDNVLITELWRRDINIIEPGVILDIFRRFNRLPQGEVDFEIIQCLDSSHKVDMIITGVVDKCRSRTLRSRGSTPNLEFSCRYINTESGTVISAYNFSGRGKDYETIFELGVVNSLGVLMKKAAQKAIDKLNTNLNKRYHAKRI